MPWLALVVVALLFLGSQRKTPMSVSKKVAGYKNGEELEIEVTQIADDKWLRFDAAAAFKRMEAAANAEGVFFGVNSAWRSYAEQVALYAKYKAGGALAAPPGYSNHQAGTAVDLNTQNGTNGAFKWLQVNAARFDFARTVSSEPWHWEYVGFNTTV